MVTEISYNFCICMAIISTSPLEYDSRTSVFGTKCYPLNKLW